MNVREKYEQLERRLNDLEARIERLDGKIPAHRGGCTTTDDGTIFAPGTGPIRKVTERPWVWVEADHSNCTAGCVNGFLWPDGPDGGVTPCPGAAA